ncbi:MAG: hypothetical protein V1933_03000 [Candidatus Omnitrophota bacterium]
MKPLVVKILGIFFCEMLLDPATRDNFFGRRDILELLKKRVDDLCYGYRQNIAIIGPPYYGKTSIIYRLVDDVSLRRQVAVYVDVNPVRELHSLTVCAESGFRLPSVSSGNGRRLKSAVFSNGVKTCDFLNFAERFISTLLFKYLRALGSDIRDSGELMLAASEKMPKTAKAANDVETLIKSGKLLKAYSAVLELSAIAYAETSLHPVIIFDEFHRIEDFGIKDAFVLLGKSIMLQKDVMYIMASSKINQAKEILSEKLSLLFGNFEIYELETFDFSTAIDFIGFRLDGKNLRDDLCNFLTAFTNGHPFYLDCVLVNLSNYLNANPQSDHSGAVIKVFNDLLFDSKGILNQHFVSIVSDLDKLNLRYASILVSISNGNNKIQSILSVPILKSDEARLLLSKLVDLGWIKKYGVFYSIADKVFEFWLKNVYQSKEYFLDSGYSHKIDRFYSEIKAYINGFSNVNRDNYLDFLPGLFSSFDGELIEIDKRSFRFPKLKLKRIQSVKTGLIHYLVLAGEKCLWILLVSLEPLTDNDIAEFVDYCRSYKKDVKRKIIVSTERMDANTLLAAKQSKIWIWTLKEINELLDISGRQRIVLFGLKGYNLSQVPADLSALEIA